MYQIADSGGLQAGQLPQPIDRQPGVLPNEVLGLLARGLRVEVEDAVQKRLHLADLGLRVVLGRPQLEIDARAPDLREGGERPSVVRVGEGGLGHVAGAEAVGLLLRAVDRQADPGPAFVRHPFDVHRLQPAEQDTGTLPSVTDPIEAHDVGRARAGHLHEVDAQPQ